VYRRYKAPELRKSKKISTHIDVFSFGIILLEILTGRKPGKAPGSDTTVVLQELVKAAVEEERLHDVLDLELLKRSICTPTENGLLEVKYSCQSYTLAVSADSDHIIFKQCTIQLCVEFSHVYLK
jgi:serine/threonine protein kinase